MLKLDTRLWSYISDRLEEEILRTVDEEPESLTIQIDGGSLLQRCAYNGLEAAVAGLLERGADPNFQTTCYSETPLEKAATKGHLRIVEMLLRHNADFRLGRPVISAIYSGNLDIVKLLVHRGADLSRLYDAEFTALGYAESRGETEIANYLRSLGAMTSKEALAAEKAARGPGVFGRLAAKLGLGGQAQQLELQTDLIEAHFEDAFGIGHEMDLAGIFGRKPPVSVSMISPSPTCENLVMFTSGLSLHEMRVPDGNDDYRRAELYVELAPDWPSPFEDPEAGWPLEWLLNIADYPKRNRTWLGGPATIIANGEPPERFSPSTPYSCWLLLADRSIPPDGRLPFTNSIQLYRLFPIYAEERRLEQKHGIQALLDALETAGIDHIAKPSRPNVGLLI
ncbi:MAG: suppressor of fused domain protein [Planctomycetaceae bacterium]